MRPLRLRRGALYDAATDGGLIFPLEAYRDDARAALEAALPTLLSHERQQTTDAHRDAIVNRDTANRLQAKLDKIDDYLRPSNWHGEQVPPALWPIVGIMDEVDA